jgi:hypothetical protein
MGYLLQTSNLFFSDTVIIKESDFLDIANTPYQLLDSGNTLGFQYIILAASIKLINTTIPYTGYTNIWLKGAGGSGKIVGVINSTSVPSLGSYTSFSINVYTPPGALKGVTYDSSRALEITSDINPVGDGDAEVHLIYYKLSI